ncbi:hypothetical protein DOK67_0000690 [Enterococcus sp. DIV0212c]|uniref:ABC transporter permease n=1 Tax=Enterococcus sp. DIV0212c TaxID=2230867 RepID=UPI001A9BD885|nr:ABC transporter permease [Enterococcus sp. DIV0212c]MBO1354659.1 ABC transporter permease [Enterococcus sp. DIV0212c]
MSLTRLKVLINLFYPKEILKSIILKKLLFPLFTFLFYFMFIKDISIGFKDTTFLALLAMFTGISSSFFYLINFSRLERISGVTELIIAAPVSNFVLLIEKASLILVDSIVSTNFNFLILGFCFNMNLSFFFGISVQSILVIYALQYMFLTLIFILLTMYIDNINLFLNIFISSIQIFSGIFFPISVFGDFIMNILNLFPLVNLITSFRLLLTRLDYRLNITFICEELIKLLLLFLIFSISNKLIIKKSLKKGTMFNQ